MTGFGRALRGEWYALWRRRGRWVFVALVAAVFLRVLAAALWQRATGGGDGGALPAAHQNFWPRFAEAARFGLMLAEVCVLVMVSGALPREVASAAVRDPLTRRISRGGYLAAKAVIALALPLLLGATAVGSAALWSRCFFRPGPIVDEPILYQDDPQAAAAYREFLAAHDLRPERLAEWVELTADGADPERARRTLGLPAFALPEGALEAWPIPFLVRFEHEVCGEVARALRASLPALLASGWLALALAALLPNVLLAVAGALGLVIVSGVFLPPALGAGARWLFPVWLPGMGGHSLLERAQRLADGYSDVPALPAAAWTAAWLAPAAAALLCLLVAQLAFRRKPL